MSYTPRSSGYSPFTGRIKSPGRLDGSRPGTPDRPVSMSRPSSASPYVQSPTTPGRVVQTAQRDLAVVQQKFDAMEVPDFSNVEADEFARRVSTAFGQMASALRSRYQPTTTEPSNQQREDSWLAHQVSMLSEQIVQLKNDIMRRALVHTESQKSLTVAQERVKELSGKLGATDGSIATMSASVSELNGRLGKAKAARDSFKDGQTKALQEVDKLKSSISQSGTLGEDNIKLKTLIAELQVELAQLQELNSQLEEKNKELSRFEAQIRPLKEQIEAKRLLELELRQRITMLEAETRSLVEAIEGLKTELAAALAWKEKYNTAVEDLEAQKRKGKEDLQRQRKEFEEATRAMKEQLDRKDEERNQLLKEITAQKQLTATEQSAHSDTKRRLLQTETELQGSRGQLGRLAAEYHKFQDEAAAQEKKKLESQQRALNEAHMKEIDQQARAAIVKIANLERSLADSKMHHEAVVDRNMKDIDQLQTQLAVQPIPEAPLVENEDVATVCKRLRAAYDKVNTDPSAIIAVAEILHALTDLATDSVPNCFLMVRFGTIPLIVQCLYLQDDNARCNAACLLSVLAREEEAQTAMTPALGPLVTLIRSNNSEATFHALNALRLLSHGDEQATELLINYISAPDPAIKRLAMFILRNLVYLPQAKEETRSCDGVKCVVECVFVEGDDELRRSAMWACALLAINPENRNELRKAGFIPRCVDALQTDDADLCKAAVQALVPLSINLHNKAELRDINALPILLTCFKSADEEVRRGAVRTLCNMSMTDDCKSAVRLSGAIPPLINALSFPDMDSQMYAVRAVAYLSMDKACRDEIEKYNPVLALVSFLSHKEEKIVRDAADALQNMVQNTASRQILRKGSSIKQVIRLFLRCSITTSSRTKAAALAVLSQQAVLPDVRQQFAGESQLLEEVVQCLRSNQNELNHAALDYLLAMLSDNELFNGPLLPLVKAVMLPSVIASFSKSSDYDTLGAANDVAACLLKNDECRSEFIKSGGVSLILRAISSVSTRPQRAGSSAAAALSIYVDGKSKLMELLRPLIGCMSSDDVVTKRNSCKAVSAAIRVVEMRKVAEGFGLAQALDSCAVSLDHETRDTAVDALAFLRSRF